MLVPQESAVKENLLAQYILTDKRTGKKMRKIRDYLLSNSDSNSDYARIVRALEPC